MPTPEQEFVRLHVQPFHGRDDTPASAAWIPCLEIPLHRLSEFSLKPYRWLCYAGYCIMGAEGSLSFDPDSTEFDYDAPLRPCDLYYHAHGPIFPIDPDLENASKTSYSTGLSDSSPLKTLILERDESCVATNIDASYCRAAHLIVQSQGSQYIRMYTEGRSGGKDEDVIDDIDDPRNGLLVNVLLHGVLGQRAAILPTPNFIMKTTHVVDTETTPDAPRWTLHFFVEPNTPGTPYEAIPPGGALRVPPDGERDTWPPQCLFAAVYASALLTTWPAKDFLKQVRSYWSSSFYPGAEQSREEAAERKARVYSEKRARRDGEMDTFDMLLIVSQARARKALAAMDRDPVSQQESAQKANDDARGKVLPWLQGID
ncbi:uncharacterized protein EV420DRAFT_1027101 [Desarmillaria tabescens]|uniref:HNH nuclease domain-containing protein n=1 Tax=Armillaria tabescens TaxID=1929756 RepID=A0AA39JIM9_ARMTA|nr:uncharacterized protein EV420DRAFT_1027101 [Desarmillaria tabescens]KAK0443348.1 hypothetical protein EV420DRAFT_1027101 [Desarmillaria tabescens]